MMKVYHYWMRKTYWILKNIIFITKYIVTFIKTEERNEKIKT
jgi:hypothetical protein